jgi:hypothetical protein
MPLALCAMLHAVFSILNSALPAYRQAGEFRIPHLDTANFFTDTGFVLKYIV